MVLPGDDCDECAPAYLRRGGQASTAVIFSSLPFFVTFLFVATIVFQRLFPLLSGEKSSKITSDLFIPTASPRNANSRSAPHKRFSAIAFSTTIALATVLAELFLCEISDTINPVARGIALRVTIFLLLILLLVVIPSLEIQSFISTAGYKYTGNEAGRLKIAWILHGLCFGIWTLGFWWSGNAMLAKHHEATGIKFNQDFATEHVGVIGISLMALLSGFASVSAPWQSFFARPKPTNEAAIARKQAGLDSTNEMLQAKRSRLRALQHKTATQQPEGLLQKAIGTFRTNADVTERKMLEIEINGLENMALSLSTSLSLLSSRLAQQNRSRTAFGRLIRVASHIFSIYCIYRIATTLLTFIRRRLASPSDHFVGSDPINNILALLVKHYDSQLDREAWTRQISFLLSGIMLLASFSSVLQTFHLFARFTPGLLKAAQANLALIVAQISATYVISVALLLRGIMPGEVVGERLRGLGGTNLQWVDGWFEAWFIGGVLVTGVGVWVARKIRSLDEWDDDEDIEMGKMS